MIKRQAVCVYLNIVGALTSNCFGEATSVTYSEFMCDTFIIHHAKRMLHILWTSVAFLPVSYSSRIGSKTARVTKTLFKIKY